MFDEQPYQNHHYHYEQNSHHASAQEKAHLLDNYCGPGNGAGPRLSHDEYSHEKPPT